MGWIVGEKERHKLLLNNMNTTWAALWFSLRRRLKFKHCCRNNGWRSKKAKRNLECCQKRRQHPAQDKLRLNGLLLAADSSGVDDVLIPTTASLLPPLPPTIAK